MQFEPIRNLCTLVEFRSAPIMLTAQKAIATLIYVVNTSNYNSLKFIVIHFNFPLLAMQDNICTRYWTKAANLRMESAKLNYIVLVLQIPKN